MAFWQSPSVSDKNSWDTSTQHFFYFWPPPISSSSHFVYRSQLTKSSAQTLEGQEDSEVSQRFLLRLCLIKTGILAMGPLDGSSGEKSRDACIHIAS